MSFLAALLSLLFLFGLTLGGIYTLYLLFSNYQPTRRKLRNDSRKILAALSAKEDVLIPLDGEELGLLSLNQTDQSRKKGVVALHEGIVTSIYHEPVIAYTYRRYPGNPKTALLCARTANHEFVYTFKKGEIHIEVDGSELGQLRDKARLYGARNQQLLASIDRDSSDERLPVSILNREVGQLTRPTGASKSTARAFQLLSQMKPEERLILLSLTILETVSATIEEV